MSIQVPVVVLVDEYCHWIISPIELAPIVRVWGALVQIAFAAEVATDAVIALANANELTLTIENNVLS